MILLSEGHILPLSTTKNWEESTHAWLISDQYILLTIVTTPKGARTNNFQFVNLLYLFFQFIISCWLYPLIVHISTVCWLQIYDIWPVKTMRWCKLSWQESQHKFIQNWLTDLNTGVPGGHMNGWFCMLFPTYCASGRTGKEGNGNGSWKLQQLNYCTGRFEMTWSSSPEATPPSTSHLLHFSP